MTATDQQGQIEAFLEAFKRDVAKYVVEQLRDDQTRPDDLLTMDEVAKRLGYKSVRACRNLTYSHHGKPPELPTVRVGSGSGAVRVMSGDLDAFIEARRVAGKGTSRR